MNIYDTANKLANEIRQSEEYRNYKIAKCGIQNNLELKQKVDDFEKMRYDIQVLALQGKEQETEKTKKLEEMYQILMQNEEIKKYFDLEVKFNIMIADVNKIIAESIKDVL